MTALRTQKWLWLSYLCKIPKSHMIKLYDEFSDIDNIYAAQREDYEKLSFLKEEEINRLCDKSLNSLSPYISSLEKNKVRIITRDMESYPKQLFCISSFPSVLYVKGKNLNLNRMQCVSVVGSRTPGSYGKSITAEISTKLARSGFVVVSGMADGVDSVAHRSAVECGAPTVAVLGCGVDIVYPKGNYELSKKIEEVGMIISEYPLSTHPEKFYFPERNKIIAALSMGTVVTEANLKSGSLITAQWAKKYGKDLFAVPGNITSKLSGGTNELIRQGAVAVTGADDVCSYYGVFKNERDDEINNDKSSYNTTDEKEEAIIKALEREEMLNIDGLSYATGLSLSELSSTLLFMEVKDIIKRTGTDMYMLVLK
ncbi:MAG: DNA-protecting protein DprA [Ruminococcaceae bacterium]|nr:DNA-protecting protein DprA [Oscillospiraceae bacterium]